jgi:HEAT repeat protein
VDDPARSLPDLVRFALDLRDDDRILLGEDLISIFRHLRAPEALPFFVELVRDDPHEIPDELGEFFVLFPARSSGLLLDLYEELGAPQGSEIAFLLASLRVRDPRIFQLLVRRLESEPGETAFCLGIYGDPAGKPELERLLEADPPPWVRQSVEEALADIDSPAPQADHPAFDIWEQYPEQAEPVFSVLSEQERLEILASPSVEYRAGAASDFFNQELSPTARDKLFDAGRRDPDAEVRARAWEALAEALDQPEVREAMLARLGDPQAPLEERCGALVGLAAEAGDPAVRQRMIEFYGVPASRAKALQAMSRSLDRRFASYFPKHLDDADPEVRRCAIRGVGHLSIRTEVGRLRTLFDDPDFRDDALFAYTLAVPAEISRGRAKALLRKVDRDAAGLSASETELVRWAIDNRLASLGLEPVFAAQDDEPSPAE